MDSEHLRVFFAHGDRAPGQKKLTSSTQKTNNVLKFHIEDSVWDQLKACAREVSKNAYCPYSNFRVGASVLGASGKLYAGCNVENASFGLTICAERAAIFSAISSGETKIQALVIYTPTESVTPPCGACRQVIAEFGPEVAILSFSDQNTSEVHQIQELLPSSFQIQVLKS